MLETLSVRPRICEQIRSGPLGQWIDDFVDVLTTRGYETSVMRRHVRAAAIFSAWLDRQRVAATEIDEPLVTRFISGLPRWRAPKRRHGRVSNVAGGVRLLAAHLRTRGVAPHPGPVADRCETEQWLQRYDDHLVQVHGLVVGTRRIYRRYAAALLAECAGTPTPDWSRLTVPTIAAFVQARASGLCPVVVPQPGHGHPCVSPLPCHPRCGSRPYRGRRPDHPRMEARRDCPAPSPMTTCNGCWPRWTRRASSGHRDRAILLLLSRLGLRAGEAAALTVNARRLAQRGCPCGRQRGTGATAAIACRRRGGLGRRAGLAALGPARPDVFFVTAHAAVSAAQQCGSVTDIAKRALRRAGVTVPRSGAHVFRHTFASQMVRREVPMKTVADLLGHARLGTTAIYAKLDRETLATIALPWPGGAR